MLKFLPELKYKNHKDLGYLWVCDVLYDPDAPEGVNDDLSVFDEFDHVLGERLDTVAPSNYFGVYRRTQVK